MQPSHKPATRPIRNNRIVFGLGFLTGLVISLWIIMFLEKFLPVVLR